MVRRPIYDVDSGHDPYQLRDGAKGNEGGVGGDNLQDARLPRPQREDPNGGQVHDTSRSGGVLSPDNINAKSGRPVIDVLWQKHLAPIIPDVEVLEYSDIVPELVPLDITEDRVKQISRQLTGAAGPGGIDATGLQQWLLRFDVSSQRLRHEVALLACWMANNIPPWTVTYALLANQLMALDK